ncbi:proteasome regulatory complex component protein, putative [Ichthyophthirius multifiliis]|uniref:Proteasome regulatory complex component protein, putative n=1 Tax=Ichthyophthirius multifiliis TaxID=5932 RepID=G0R6K2_ICHMU|nr:proteasome regulatory complex component protein, putative [Ichthyophthirius multifiliis]EGR26895.1 proteasome regulatory complex component protein, putative [Ichthyophthirius multifiliis]|eukprot:XP_004023779.1 proteasome regulatory complex component protein, putative [Ichthyophthirius multifiliis]
MSTKQYIQLLSEKDNQLKIIGLQKLEKVVDSNWAELAEHLTDMQKKKKNIKKFKKQSENLYDDLNFPRRDLAYSLASKVYFCLEEYEESLNLALESGSYFQITEKSQYVEVLVSTCIEKYIEHRKSGQDSKLNEKYTEIVEKMFTKCIREQEYRHALGIAVESQRCDKIKQILEEAEETKRGDLVNYLYEVCTRQISNKLHRNQILRLLISFYQSKLAFQGLQNEEYVNLSLCYHKLGLFEEFAQLLHSLLQKNVPLAFQLAVEISDNQNYGFVKKVIETLPVQNEAVDPQNDNRSTLIEILQGKTQNKINFEVLKYLNKSDPALIKQILTAVDTKKQVAHTAVALCNAILSAGTADQKFLSENLEWAQKSQLWARFSQVASLGMIYSTCQEDPKKIFKDFLPGNTNPPNFYSNGGSLYGIGLMDVGKKTPELIKYFTEIIKNPQHNNQEAIVHGACLAIGLSGLASEDEQLFEQLKDVMLINNAVTGESAALAIGLIMAGTNNENAITELLKFGQDTQHEKIIRALGVALALISFGQEQNADTLIEQQLQEKDFILRYGGALTLGLAYAGTANNKAIRQLLHYAVDDVADDVRRAAVIGLGFVMFNSYEQITQVMSLLAMSYNPHVRYGTAIALGIACAGTGFQEALDMIEPMLTDSTDFVRQGAMIGTALILQQCNVKQEPKLDKFKKTLQIVYTKKHEDILCKLGAVLSMGILEAGGRNQVARLGSQSGFPKLASCVGMVVFTNFWYWFPYVNFLSLCLSSSTLVGIDQTLRIPTEFSYKINCKKSLFDYPENIKPDDGKNKKEVEVVQLSTTVKVKTRATNKEKDNKIEEELPQQQKQDDKKEEIKEEEPTFYIQQNPGRVLEKQQKHIEFIQDHRYQPILKDRKFGIIFLNDTQQEQEKKYLGEQKKQEQPQVQPQPQPTQNDDIQPPEDFIYDESAQLLQ